ncbi:MAG: hypothetical protein LBM70_05645 [Victivallales bacterium]|jgi:mannitol-1-phosphate 5-dehydrogenase|nr:hypothetical protein [Victivallales bacterium]
MRKIFLGIGAGPIQTGIFVSGAWHGNFDRIVLSEVDPAIVAAIRRAGSITVNTAGVGFQSFDRVEVYNPTVLEDANKLKEVAAEAIAVNTALPSVDFYRFAAPYLAEGFAKSKHAKYVYTSENSTTAAEELRRTVGEFPDVYYLDTVIGKMSKVFNAADSDLPPLAPGSPKGHLVEVFNTIYSSSAAGIEDVGIEGLFPKPDLHPFEEAKLYGHNAVHFLLGVLAAEAGLCTMDEAAAHPELMAIAHNALIDECGAALCRKYAGVDDYFIPGNFRAWGEELLNRMVSPELADSVERIIRDPNRKLGWNDRLIGAIHLCFSQKIVPCNLLTAIIVLQNQVDWKNLTQKWSTEIA